MDTSWIWGEQFLQPWNNSRIWENTPIFTPKTQHMWFSLPIAGFLILSRLLWESFVPGPSSIKPQKLKNTPQTPTKNGVIPHQNGVLETAFLQQRNGLTQTQIQELSKKTDLSTRQVERWWRKRRRNDEKPSELSKFRETSWKCSYYLISFCYGVAVLWDKPWTWETKLCWTDLQEQKVSVGIWWYYMGEMGYYMAAVVLLGLDTKRKDFVLRVIHHVTALSLLGLSWSYNFIRIGSLVLVVHDAADFLLQLAKVWKYLLFHKASDFTFVAFAVTWYVTRLGIFPFRILWSSLTDSIPEIKSEDFHMYYVCNGLLCTILVLSILWSYFITRVFYNLAVKGENAEDNRSDNEDDD